MKTARWAIMSIILIVLFSQSASAQTWVNSLRQVVVALGWLMMIIMGIKWIMSDSANERAEAKKGMLYIVIGLLIINLSCNLLCIYCDAAFKSVNTWLCNNMGDYGCAPCGGGFSGSPH